MAINNQLQYHHQKRESNLVAQPRPRPIPEPQLELTVQITNSNALNNTNDLTNPTPLPKPTHNLNVYLKEGQHQLLDTPITLVTSTTTRSSSSSSAESFSSSRSIITETTTSCTNANISTSSITSRSTSRDTSRSISTSVSASSSSSSSSSNSSICSSSSSSNSTRSIAKENIETFAQKGKGITYSPYHDNFQCKSHSEIATDLTKLQTFDIIRLYSPDCDCISGVMNAMQSHQKIFAGLFYMNTIEQDIKLLTDQVNSNLRGWNAIMTVSIGNEWLNTGEYKINEVISAIQKTKSLLKQNGYNGPVVNVDTFPAYKSNPKLCEFTDIVTVNAHAYWDGNIKPEDSGKFLQSQISELETLCEGKEVLITETGWPTQGQTFGSVGIPGKSEQLACIKSISELVSNKVIFFTVYNDFWKAPGPYGVEQYWGLYV